MIAAQPFRILCVGLTLGLAGCVSQTGEVGSGARNVLCQGEGAGPASYMSSDAPWDLSAKPVDSGNIPGYRQRLEQDARTKRQYCP
jgi:hypothetical protein